MMIVHCLCEAVLDLTHIRNNTINHVEVNAPDGSENEKVPRVFTGSGAGSYTGAA